MYMPSKKAPVDFTKQMKKEYTIIAPDIFPTHMEILQELFKMQGYNLFVAHYEGKEVVDTGLKYMQNDMCYPAICSTGQQIYALQCGDFDPDKCALIQFQTGGGCRASNYIWLLRKALKNMGWEHIPVISLSLTGIEKYSGFKFTLPLMLKSIMAIIYGDMLMLLKNQTTPYEVNKGDTRKVLDKWVGEIVSQFKANKGLTPKKFRENLEGIAKDFADIEIKKTPKIKVGIVGEIYVKFSSFGNNGLEKFLESQGVEYMVPGVLGFFQYCFANIETDYKYYGGNWFVKQGGKIAEYAASKVEGVMLDVLKKYPQFTAPAPFAHIKKLGEKVIDRGVKMGEGWLLPAETAELIEKGYSNVICTQPFGCLPNHIVGKGVIRSMREIYPNANIFPIDFDAGASKVNQENRIKLMLSVAQEEMNL